MRTLSSTADHHMHLSQTSQTQHQRGGAGQEVRCQLSVCLRLVKIAVTG